MVIAMIPFVTMVLVMVVDVFVFAMYKTLVLVLLVAALSWACVARVPHVVSDVPKTIGQFAIVVAATVA
jgi:hypothetical protein